MYYGEMYGSRQRRPEHLAPSPSFVQAGQLAEPREQQALISGEGVREDDHRNQRRRVLLEDVVEAEVLTPPLVPLTDDLPRPLR